MSTMLSLDTGAYSYTQRSAAGLFASFFRGVLHAPASYLSLGREIDRLARVLEILISEAQNPDSKILRKDNAAAAPKLLSIAFDGIHDSLVEVENTLVGLHVSRHKSERWMDFAIKIQFHGGEERLQELEQRISYHCWAFDLAMQTLMKEDIQELVASIQTVAVAVHLKRLLYEQVNGFEGDPIFCRFDELSTYRGKYLFVDFRADLVIRIIMFWTFKAISSLSHVAETRHVSPDGYLNLLKAAWLLQNVRSSPRINMGCDETKAVVALVSTELLFTFKTLVKVGCFPERDILKSHGDFRIFPEHLTHLHAMIPSTEKDHQTALEQEILDHLSEVSSRSRGSMVSTISIGASSTQGLGQSPQPQPPPPPPPPYTAVETPAEPRSPPPLIPPPNIPQQPIISKKKRPTTLRVDVRVQGDNDVLKSVKPLRDAKVSMPTPPSSALSQLGRTTSKLPFFDNSTKDEGEDEGEDEDGRPSPSPSAIIDSIYCDSPTLGSEEYYDGTNGPKSPESAIVPAVNPSLHVGLSPELPPLQIRAPLKTQPSLDPSQGLCHDPGEIEEKIALSRPASRSKENVVSGIQDSSSRPPSPGGLIVNDGEEDWSMDFAVEYGVKPGERELMPESFGPMKLKASETCSTYAHWEDCAIRIFENLMTGEYRILTLRGRDIDQRHVQLSLTELVPEYGYHQNFPVIYLRQAGPGMYSHQSAIKEKAPKPARKSSVSSASSAPQPATLYYQFLNLFDMFTFQQAFLQESIEADVQNVRTIRYTRGFLSGDHTTHKARIQLWKPPATELSGGTSSTHRNSLLLTHPHPRTPPTLRSAAPSELTRIKPTRLVLYLDEIAIAIFVTDDLVHAIPNASPRTLRIRPSSHRAFNNPSSVKACVLGDPKRDLAGGFRLDKDGIGIDMQEAFEDFKWFEIEFQTEIECRAFADEFSGALQQRRRERRMIEELKKKAGRGVRAGEW